MWFFYSIVSSFSKALGEISEKGALIRKKALDILIILNVINVLLLLPLVYWMDFSLSLYQYILIFVSSLVCSFAGFAEAKVLKNSDISIVAPLKNFIPMFVLILAFVFLGEKITSLQFVGIVILFLGAYLLEMGKGFKIWKPIKDLQNKYLLLFFLGILAFSIVLTLDKAILNTGVQVLTFLFISRFFRLINYSLFFLVSRRDKIINKLNKRIQKPDKMTLISSISFTIASLSYLMAISVSFVSLIVPIVYQFSTAISTIIGGKAYHEKRLLYRTIICIFMIFGVLLVVVNF